MSIGAALGAVAAGYVGTRILVKEKKRYEKRKKRIRVRKKKKLKIPIIKVRRKK